jgi:hypothetical protein
MGLIRRPRAGASAVLASIALVFSIGAEEAIAKPAERASNDWYWSSGLCKSLLQKYGMEIDDGRVFTVARAFCVGIGGEKTCWWNKAHSNRLYNRFMVVVRSPDGTVRSFSLRTVGEDRYRAANIQSYGKETDAAFIRSMGPLADKAARDEQANGCGE